MQFTLERTGLITGSVRDLQVTVSATGEGGWHWTIDDETGPLAGVAAATLDEALEACAKRVDHDVARWTLELPCGNRITRPGRMPVEEALGNHGYHRAEGGRAYLSLAMPGAATPRQARIELLVALDDAERRSLGSVDLFERTPTRSHFCADLPLPISGFVHDGQLPLLAKEALSAGAAALAVNFEADYVTDLAPAPVPVPR